MIVQFGQPPRPQPTAEKALPERWRSKRVLEKTPNLGGFDLTLSCRHQLWVPVDPGERFYCGSCLVELLARERAVFRRAISYTLRRHSCDVTWQHRGDVL